MRDVLNGYLFFIRHKDTKKSIHFQIIAAVSSSTDAVLPFSGGVSSINDDDLEMDAVKNKYLSRSEDVSIVMKYRILSFQKKATNE
jgi:hypothetical protein